ncbi:hypothetical protein FB45DRAFT_1116462 [Roridomyces roridus]|uniref:F-box domain-containing protein n=1 Tax=Roridomyces roridus TaxID=1738132 RepID=A0AAD7CCB1_9AGAR|nr:hypothetical protein FB45DRAFT_1116462 [Roridomyces roridus]
MSSRERVPTEIWLEIFGHLPLSSLKQTSLTQREFKSIARTLLFNHFRLQPYASHYKSGAVPHTPAVVKRNVERLDFWSSSESESLACVNHPSWTISISRTATSSLASTSTPPGCSCVSPSFATRPTEEKADLWIPLLHPEHLRVLEVFADPYLKLMNETMVSSPVFPHVHTLRTSVIPGTLSRNLLAWSKFPGVRSLGLSNRGVQTSPFGPTHPVVCPDVMPLLEEYEGCPHALHLFAARATLMRVCIDHCSLDGLIACLNWVQSPQVTSFNIGLLDVLDVSNLSVIFNSFPMLQALRIFVLNNDDEAAYGWEGGCSDSTSPGMTNHETGSEILLNSRGSTHTPEYLAMPDPHLGIRIQARRHPRHEQETA